MPARRSKTPRPARRSPADKHRLYERAVQDADTELALLLKIARRGGRAPRRFREDFSGTALLASGWVAGGREREATAVDFNPEVHAWAREHRVPALGEAAKRLTLVTTDVREPNGGGFDLVAALNFSYGTFQTREALLGYLRAARRALAPRGTFVLDVFGGHGAIKDLVERRRIGEGWTYVWEQKSFDPITHHMRCAIHFERKGRRVFRDAFTYDWRLWTVPELQELLGEAGFPSVEVYWDVAPEGEDVRYVPRARADAQWCWIAYVVGRA